MTDDRWQRAVHELGHALTDLRFGRTVRFVSIRDGLSHSGIASSHLPERYRVDLDALLGDEVPLTDPRARGIVDAAVIGFLAGDIAERSVAPPSSGYRPAAPPSIARAVEELTALRPRHRELLGQFEARTETRSDDDQARDFTERLAGAETAAYLEWLRAVAVRMVAEQADNIRRLAPVLVQEEVIDGERLAALVNEGGAADEQAA